VSVAVVITMVIVALCVTLPIVLKNRGQKDNNTTTLMPSTNINGRFLRRYY
jgi:energy-converting hydrogenase Eha subunit A